MDCRGRYDQEHPEYQCENVEDRIDNEVNRMIYSGHNVQIESVQRIFELN